MTATRRNETLASVPLAISVIGGEDARPLLVSPIYASSTSYHHRCSSPPPSRRRRRRRGSAAWARLGPIRARKLGRGVRRRRLSFAHRQALTELGAVDRIEVLRGPQGTLFGRNASAGLIHVITASPRFTTGGTAEFGYGNHDQYRGQIGLTGPITQITLAYRIDGVWTKRDGFIRDTISGRDVNNRNRWLARGQLLFRPDDALSIRIIGDYARRKEQVLRRRLSAGTRRRARRRRRRQPRALLHPRAGACARRPYQRRSLARKTALTPGAGLSLTRARLGLSSEINYAFGAMKLTTITAWRHFRLRARAGSPISTISISSVAPMMAATASASAPSPCEVRLQGKALGGRRPRLPRRRLFRGSGWGCTTISATARIIRPMPIA